MLLTTFDTAPQDGTRICAVYDTHVDRVFFDVVDGRWKSDINLISVNVANAKWISLDMYQRIVYNVHIETCPHCGSHAKMYDEDIVIDGLVWKYIIRCTNFNCRHFMCGDDSVKLRKRWNRRTGPNMPFQTSELDAIK